MRQAGALLENTEMTAYGESSERYPIDMKDSIRSISKFLPHFEFIFTV
jgi:hypothetical protein